MEEKKLQVTAGWRAWTPPALSRAPWPWPPAASGIGSTSRLGEVGGGTRHKNGSFDKFLMGKWGKTVAFVCSCSGFWWGKQWESTQICKIIDFDRRVWVLADKLWRGRVFGFGHISVFGYVPAKNFKIEDMLEFTFRLLVWYIWSAYMNIFYHWANQPMWRQLMWLVLR